MTACHVWHVRSLSQEDLSGVVVTLHRVQEACILCQLSPQDTVRRKKDSVQVYTVSIVTLAAISASSRKLALQMLSCQSLRVTHCKVVTVLTVPHDSVSLHISPPDLRTRLQVHARIASRPEMLACRHYVRGCSLHAPCCGNAYHCRHCHDTVVGCASRTARMR